MKKTVLSELFNDANNLFASRNKEYGNGFARHGELMAKFFPNGVTLETEEDFKRYGLISALVSKLNRVTFNFEEGHSDSVEDLGVYAFMLQAVEKDLV